MPLGRLQERVQVFCTRKSRLGASLSRPEEMDRFLQGGLHFLHG